MPVVIRPLRDCIARPDADGCRFGLIEHLLAVAGACHNRHGTPEEKLGFLAGLLHDAAKASAGWQEYIRLPNPKRGPPHAALGAALFAFWADDLIPRWAGADRTRIDYLSDLGLDWTRILCDHHGRIGDLLEEQTGEATLPPWVTTAFHSGEDPSELIETCDQEGLLTLVREAFPESQFHLKDFQRWYGDFDDFWLRRVGTVRPGLLRKLLRVRRQEDVPLAEEGLRLAELGDRLIFADRSDAADWDVSLLDSTTAGQAIEAIQGHCRQEAENSLDQQADPRLVAARGQLLEEAVAKYREQTPDAWAFTLLLPTGYGKTLTGLRVALEACRAGRCERVIYVAPYLSILSQAADDIEKATALDVFQHHHLTAATLEDHQPYDVLDTWQAPLLATTFNQFFRALFPNRAQQCLRIRALHRAFLFIDEPQIVDTKVWNVFLRALAVGARRYGYQVLFSTATLPPLDEGLGAPPVPLAPVVQPTTRYVIRTEPQPWKAAETATQAQQRLQDRGSVAVIVNTIRDAVQVFRLAHQKAPGRWLCLTAMMLPGHKAQRIAGIKERLDPKQPGGPQPTGVVCTQVLEAGVNLSFRALLRALPVLSSIAQAAGRANRHGEGEPVEVCVFRFLRDDETDSRPFVYRDRTALRQTDALLQPDSRLPEERLPAVLDEYYRRCWAENAQTGPLERFGEAARGRWSALAGLEPFGGDGPRLEVFIPGAEQYLSDKMRGLLQHFGAVDARDLLGRYLDGSLRRR
ncbi:MAG: CRISPR-associated endonuclease Cas3'', partial [Planctomycetota bacterium]|nr:CRISPR-associated endonuclease Cas3'' [Planctomycetota bacterium]